MTVFILSTSQRNAIKLTSFLAITLCLYGSLVSCQKHSPSELQFQEKIPLVVGDKVLIDGEPFTIEEDLTNGNQARVYKASSKLTPGSDIVIKQPMESKFAIFSYSKFFDSFSRFSEAWSNDSLASMALQSKADMTANGFRSTVYIQDYLDGLSLDTFITKHASDYDALIAFTNDLALTIKLLTEVSVEKKAIISDIAKPDNIIINPVNRKMHIIDAIVFDDTISNKNAIKASDVIKNKNAVETLYLLWTVPTFYMIKKLEGISEPRKMYLISNFLKQLKASSLRQDIFFNELSSFEKNYVRKGKVQYTYYEMHKTKELLCW